VYQHSRQSRFLPYKQPSNLNPTIPTLTTDSVEQSNFCHSFGRVIGAKMCSYRTTLWTAPYFRGAYRCLYTHYRPIFITRSLHKMFWNGKTWLSTYDNTTSFFLILKEKWSWNRKYICWNMYVVVTEHAQNKMYTWWHFRFSRRRVWIWPTFQRCLLPPLSGRWRQ
jgi:hypothetical protein